MILPNSYGGFTIVARKDRFGTTWLDIKNTSGKKVKTYKPPLQVIYLGNTHGRQIAYDHDIERCHCIIDRMNKSKSRLNFNNQSNFIK